MFVLFKYIITVLFFKKEYLLSEHIILFSSSWKSQSLEESEKDNFTKIITLSA